MPSLALALLVVLLAPPAAQAAPWLRPVDGTLLRAFTLGPDPYAAGRHRGVDFAAAVGSPARSACAGRVTFAGQVARAGPTVSVRCGDLVATYQGLATLAVRAGRRIGAGSRVGAIGRSRDPRNARAHLHLGAREAATGRYLDPLALLRTAPPVAPLLPRRAPPAAPRGRAPIPAAPRVPAPIPAGPRAAPRVRVRVPSPPRLAPVREPAPRPAVPWPAWAGLASIALAMPIGGFVTARRRRERAAGAAAALAR